MSFPHSDAQASGPRDLHVCGSPDRQLLLRMIEPPRAHRERVIPATGFREPPAVRGSRPTLLSEVTMARIEQCLARFARPRDGDAGAE